MMTLNKKEAKFISQELMPYLKAKMPGTYLAEAKYVRNGKYYLSDKALKKEITNLKIAGRHFCYKFPDGGLSGTPCDIVSLAESQGYLFFKFEEDQKHTFYIMTVDNLEKIIRQGFKSINKLDCNIYGDKIEK